MKRKTALGKAYEWCKSQWLMRRLLCAHRRSLKPGLYLINDRLAQRLGTRAPQHLRRTKARATLALPALVVPWGLRRRDGSCEYLVGGNGFVLIFDFAGASVKRIAGSPCFDETFLELKERLARHFSVPRGTVTDAQATTYVEQLVQGVSPDELDEAAQIELVRDLVHRSAELAAEQRQGDSRAYLDAALAETNPSLLPSELASRLATVRTTAFLAESPLVPSHGDFGLHHIVYDNGVAWVIDWDPRYVALRPFWYDPMSLFQASSALRVAFDRGAFDEAFTHLFDAVGLAVAAEEFRAVLPWAWSVTFRHACRGDEPLAVHKTIASHAKRWESAAKKAGEAAATTTTREGARAE